MMQNKMIRKIKTGISVVFIICLFLPLSECTYTSTPPVNSVEKEAVADADNVFPEPLTVTFILIDEVDDLFKENAWFLIIFLAPLILGFINSENIKAKTVVCSLQLLIIISMGYLLYDSIFVLADPLWGGIILTGVWGLYFAITIYEGTVIIKKMQRNQALHPTAASGGR